MIRETNPSSISGTPRRRRLRPFFGSAVLLSLATCWVGATAGAATLVLERTVYRPGETFEVRFSAPEAAASAWAGILPSSVAHGSESENDRHDLSYRYLGGKTSGRLSFAAPGTPGSYDVRLHDSDSDGREIASVTFEVRGGDATRARLELAKTRFIPGETIRVRFEGPDGLARNAWIGIVPSNVPHGQEAVNDRHDVSYQYLEQRAAGTLDFHAPAAAGAYDFRFNDTDSGGREIASASFEVLADVDSDSMAELLETTGRVPLYGIRFASGQASIDAASHPALAEVGQLLRRHPDLRLRIEGHTDDQGDAAFNQRLSEQRAEAVRDYLIQTLDIDPDRLRTEGHGPTRPMASNQTPAGRAQNRRVELVRL